MKAPSQFSINPRLHRRPNNVSVASYLLKGKELKAMKIPQTFIWCVFILCFTLLIFTYLTRKSLCELRYRDKEREVAALMAYESGK